MVTRLCKSERFQKISRFVEIFTRLGPYLQNHQSYLCRRFGSQPCQLALRSALRETSARLPSTNCSTSSLLAAAVESQASTKSPPPSSSARTRWALHRKARGMPSPVTDSPAREDDFAADSGDDDIFQLDELDEAPDDLIEHGDWQDNFDDEFEEDYLVLKYGPSMLVQMAREPEHVRKLLEEGTSVTANALFAAIDCGSLATLEILLSTGANPNMRLPNASNVAEVSEESLEELSPSFLRNEVEWYPLLLAAHERSVTEEARDQRTKIMNLLLDQDADIYALFRQPLCTPRRSSFPGEPHIPSRDTQDFRNIGNVSLVADNSTETGEQRPTGVRSVIHASLEDGGHVSTIFHHHNKTLDLEHRDPQGRTLLLSACRSSLGADVRIDGAMEDVEWDPNSGSYRRDPFETTTSIPSLFRFLIEAGADPMAIDHSGKNLLHHLLEAHDTISNYTRSPMIQQSLLYALEKFRSLVNQPDKFGTYPIHATLQRRRRYHVDDLHIKLADLDKTIENMLGAGADPLVRDGHGNTALHYLADDGLAGQNHIGTHSTLFALFLSRGVDINARNNRGQTVMDLAQDDDGLRAEVPRT